MTSAAHDHGSPAASVVASMRDRRPVVGFWVVLDSLLSTEALAHVGYDYLVLDAQHGVLDDGALHAGLVAIDAAHGPAGLVRVTSQQPADIGRALDLGARGVIVPLVDDAAQAAAAVAAARYRGRRSWGPIRSGLRVTGTAAEIDDQVLVLAMIETASGFDQVEQILAVEGIDGVYVGPSDLALGLGAPHPDHPVQPAFDAALDRIQGAAAAAGKIAGVHTTGHPVAGARRAAGFTMITIASDLSHLLDAARADLETLRD
ncbi:4-hydroxy-2-oxoheptanedioate aldolase [Friedmanniella endophytica]|uniref:4-hydroxy-2-oxoheptanedioate aldolase n=1 Tax=Microlunatus kandeliicorticis TaxID=1759536 RepID=A0A7W3IPS0_9ACTN|nr:aldolase/citrate lyase family protein [Microlunatus kandeliicorticis]MBA8792978.1 4-hydroxy-2-oxoheptanedioate aldolase [Microlunatus kandeliicorticis]